MNREYRYQLSCIVPIYNVEEYLEECLESLLKTPRVNMEVILVDDGSTDLSGDIADRYALREPFIKVIHQSNQGLAVARNRGLEVANGDYVVFIDFGNGFVCESGWKFLFSVFTITGIRH